MPFFITALSIVDPKPPALCPKRTLRLETMPAASLTVRTRSMRPSPFTSMRVASPASDNPVLAGSKVLAVPAPEECCTCTVPFVCTQTKSALSSPFTSARMSLSVKAPASPVRVVQAGGCPPKAMRTVPFEARNSRSPTPSPFQSLVKTSPKVRWPFFITVPMAVDANVPSPLPKYTLEAVTTPPASTEVRTRSSTPSPSTSVSLGAPVSEVPATVRV